MWKYLNKGISTPIAIGLILILVIIVGGFTWWQYGEIRKEEKMPLPEIQIPEKEEVADETADWQTYRNEKYGFEIKYPEDWKTISKFPGRFGPGQTEFVEGVNPQSFLFAPNSKDIDRNEADLVLYIAPPEIYICSDYMNVSDDNINDFLEKNINNNEIEFCKLDVYFRFSLNTPQKEILNQMLSTFKFIEEEIKTNEIKEDLNNDGQLELIITSANSEKAKGYITISKINEKGDYEKLMEFEFEGGTRGIPSVKEFRDIDNDNQKEIFLNLGAGGASTNGEGILDCDFQNRKLNWVRIQDENGKIQNAIFYVGAAVMHSDDYIIEDLDNDGNKEIIKLRGLGLQTKPEEIKPWERLREHPAGEGVWWIEEARAYEWNGSLFSYNEDLSKKYWNQ